jgi:hypothetical protein
MYENVMIKYVADEIREEIMLNNSGFAVVVVRYISQANRAKYIKYSL